MKKMLFLSAALMALVFGACNTSTEEVEAGSVDTLEVVTEAEVVVDDTAIVVEVDSAIAE